MNRFKFKEKQFYSSDWRTDCSQAGQMQLAWTANKLDQRLPAFVSTGKKSRFYVPVRNICLVFNIALQP